jgi:hypothetical protein
LASSRNFVHSRRVHGFSEVCRAALEALQQLLHRRERVGRFEQTFLFEGRRDLGDQLPAEAADIGERCKHPHGRSTERENTHELDAVTCRAAQQEILAELRIAGVFRGNLPHVLREVLQRDVDEIAIEPPAPHTDGHDDRGDFANDPRPERRSRAHETLRQRCHVLHATAPADAAQLVLEPHP